MENPKNAEHEKFTDERLAALKTEDTFQPNTAQGRMRLRSRMAQSAAPRRWVWGAATAVAVLTIVAAVSSPRASATMNEQGPSVHGFLMPVHNFLYAHWRLLMATLYGWEAPDFALTDATGKMVRLSDYQGKVVLLNFWATWCAPCREEIPGFMELQKKFGDDLVVLGISMDEDGWTTVRPYVEQHRVSYPVMLSGPDLPTKYRTIETVPTTFLISREGRIARIQNELATKAMYEGWITDLVGRRLSAR